MDVTAQIAAAIKEERVRIARLGGYGRAKSLSHKELRESAKKASKVAAEARKKKARERAKPKAGK